MKEFAVGHPKTYFVTVVFAGLLLANVPVIGAGLFVAALVGAVIYRERSKSQLKALQTQSLPELPAAAGWTSGPTAAGFVQAPNRTAGEAWPVMASPPPPGAPVDAQRTRQAGPPSLADLMGMMTVHRLDDEDLDEQIEVAGETYHIRDIRAVFKARSRPITSAGVTLEDVPCALLPEPWNPHDPHAVAVMINSNHVGYIPADQAPEYSEVLMPLAERAVAIGGRARVWAKSDGGVVRARVTILVPAADEVRA